LVRGNVDKPGKETTVIDKRLPLINIPIHILGAWHCGTRLSTKEDDDSVAFGGDKSQEENILDTAVVALESGLAELMLRMETDFLVARADEVVDDVGTG
jgi:hypothetical protein